MRFIGKKDLARITRRAGSRKGDNGRVLAIGGSHRYSGAIGLAGIAALRSGADWVTIAAPEKVALTLNKASLDIVTLRLPGEDISPRHMHLIRACLREGDIILAGNGMGETRQTKKVIDEISSWDTPKVLDADALKVVDTDGLSNAILTPHRGELEKLLENNKTTIEKIVAQDNVIIVKGKIDEIHSKRGVRFNKTGNARMSVAGTGDVLAGLCAGILAQCKDLEKASITATFLNGFIGNRLFARSGFGFTAQDMLKEIGPSMRSLGIHRGIA